MNDFFSVERWLWKVPVYVLWLWAQPSLTGHAEPPAPETHFKMESSPAVRPIVQSEHPFSIEVGVKFAEIDPDIAREFLGAGSQLIYSQEQFDKLLGQLRQRKGVELRSMPMVTIKSRQKAVIRIVREFPYPTEFASTDYGLSVPAAFETRNLGLTVEVVARFTEGGHIMATLTPSAVNSSGFINYASGFSAVSKSGASGLNRMLGVPSESSRVINQPIFESRRLNTTVALQSGQTVLVGGMEASPVSFEQLDKPVPQAQTRKRDRQLYTFVTLSALNVEGRPIPPQALLSAPSANPAIPAAAPAPVSPIKGVPAGAAVAEKPGYVISPYAPKAGYVDLRGFPSGVEVKCPYTGKIFLVP